MRGCNISTNCCRFTVFITMKFGCLLISQCPQENNWCLVAETGPTNVCFCLVEKILAFAFCLVPFAVYWSCIMGILGCLSHSEMELPTYKPAYQLYSLTEDNSVFLSYTMSHSTVDGLYHLSFVFRSFCRMPGPVWVIIQLWSRRWCPNLLMSFNVTSLLQTAAATRIGELNYCN